MLSVVLKQSNIGESLFGRASQESLDGVRKRRPSFKLSSKSLTNATRIINQHLFGLPIISNKTGIVERKFIFFFFCHNIESFQQYH